MRAYRPRAAFAIRGRQRSAEQRQSSLRMEPMPRFLENRELLLLANRSRENVSSASFLLSPLTVLVMVFVLSPGAKVNVPDLAMWSFCSPWLPGVVNSLSSHGVGSTNQPQPAALWSIQIVLTTWPSIAPDRSAMRTSLAVRPETSAPARCHRAMAS